MAEHPAAASAGGAGVARHAMVAPPCLLVPVVAIHPKVVVRHPAQKPLAKSGLSARLGGRGERVERSDPRPAGPGVAPWDPLQHRLTETSDA
jgi:hypothetical protein